MGEVAVLNVAAGDTKLTFDPNDPEEAARSAKIVDDMIKRGFVLMIEVGRDERGPLYRRATAFDPDTHEYIIAGTAMDEAGSATTESSNVEDPPAKARGRRKGTSRSSGSTRRVKASSAKAVAVARVSGG
jgi:hypothetical protein